MILPILTVPKHTATLTAVSAPSNLSGEDRKLAADMRDTLVHVRGLGLAAPQVGFNVRLIVLRPGAVGFPYFALFNPEIVWRSEEQAKFNEGCLSVPGVKFLIGRPARIKVKFTTRDGKQIETDEIKGLAARAIQHEVDHLDGVLLGHKLAQLPMELAAPK